MTQSLTIIISAGGGTVNSRKYAKVDRIHLNLLDRFTKKPAAVCFFGQPQAYFIMDLLIG